MNIVFIGPDGSGKSTIAEQWAEHLDMELIENDYREPDKLYKTLEHLDKDNVIFDRLFYPDHLIYSKIKGEEIPKDEALQWRMIAHSLRFRNIMFVYVEASDKILFDRLIVRGDDYIRLEDISIIKSEYEKMLQNFPTPVLRLTSHADYSYTVTEGE